MFSYWQQEQSCKWLVLYASDLMSGCIAYKAPTIDCSDDANIILLSKKDKSIKLYRDAHTTSAKYEACTVVDDKTVSYQGQVYSLSALAQLLTGSKYSVAGPRYFKYRGEWLNDVRHRQER